MARFYSLKKKDEDDAKTADPFGVMSNTMDSQLHNSNDSELSNFGLRKDTKKTEKPIIKEHNMAKVYEFLANGFEDIEALAPVDILRRGGLEVKTVSISGSKIVESAHGVKVEADLLFDEANFDDADLLLIPGGMPGAKNIDEHEGVRKAVESQACSGKLVGAICAGPMVLGHLGLLRGRKATCYPGFETELDGAIYTSEPYTVDGNIITGKGPGATFEYAYALLTLMKGERVVEALKKSMMYC